MGGLMKLIFGLIVGLLLGLWFGVNIGRERPLLANPFAEPTVSERLHKAGEQAWEKAGDALQDKDQH